MTQLWIGGLENCPRLSVWTQCNHPGGPQPEMGPDDISRGLRATSRNHESKKTSGLKSRETDSPLEPPGGTQPSQPP